MPLAYLALAIGMIHIQFHLFGNAAEVENFGSSVFSWTATLWQSARLFGGSVYYLGWIMPLVTLGLIYRDRQNLGSERKAVWWPGLAVVSLALALHWAGVRAQQTRLSLVALILLLWSIPLFLFGWRCALRLAFPMSLLIFCVPLNFLDALTFPMRILSARMASWWLAGLGMESTAGGSVLVLDTPVRYVLDGADPASGLGTLLSLGAIALVAGHIWRDPWPFRLALAGAVLPVVVVMGSFRLALLVVVGRLFSPDTALWVHENGGMVIMLGGSLLMLWLLRCGVQALLGDRT